MKNEDLTPKLFFFSSVFRMRPKTKTTWVILIGGAVYFLFEAIRNYAFYPNLEGFHQVQMLRNLIGRFCNAFFISPLENVSRVTLILEWFVRITRDIGMDTALSTMLIVGIINMRKKRIGLKTILFAIISLSVFLVWTMLTLKGYGVFLKYEKMYRDNYERLGKMEIDIRHHKFPGQDLPKWSKLYAKSKYELTGEKVKFLNQDAQWEIYLPDLEDQHMYELNVNSIVLLNRGKKAVYQSIIFWIAFITISICFGLVKPIKTQKDYGLGDIL